MLLCYSYANGLAIVDSPSLMGVGGRQGGTELFTRHRYFFQLATMYYMLVHPRLSNNNNIQPQTVISLKQQERECDHREEKTRSNSRLDTEQPPTSQVTCKREGITNLQLYIGTEYVLQWRHIASLPRWTSCLSMDKKRCVHKIYTQ